MSLWLQRMRVLRPLFGGAHARVLCRAAFARLAAYTADCAVVGVVVYARFLDDCRRLPA